MESDPLTLRNGVPFAPLKRQIVGLMAQRGERCAEEQVFLTRGGAAGGWACRRGCSSTKGGHAGSTPRRTTPSTARSSRPRPFGKSGAPRPTQRTGTVGARDRRISTVDALQGTSRGTRKLGGLRYLCVRPHCCPARVSGCFCKTNYRNTLREQSARADLKRVPRSVPRYGSPSPGTLLVAALKKRLGTKLDLHTEHLALRENRAHNHGCVKPIVFAESG